LVYNADGLTLLLLSLLLLLILTYIYIFLKELSAQIKKKNTLNYFFKPFVVADFRERFLDDY
jgi:phosphotransferase system  glucose/maltose/N-acetylglucosamine-specific IIC component